MDVESYYMWTEKISQREKKDDLCLEEARCQPGALEILTEKLEATQIMLPAIVTAIPTVCFTAHVSGQSGAFLLGSTSLSTFSI